MTYKGLSDRVFFGYTALLHGLIIATALLVRDIATIFDFSGAIGIGATQFVLPGIFYLKTNARYASSRHREKCSTLLYQGMSWFSIAFGIALIGVSIYTNTLKVMGVDIEAAG